MLKHCTQVAVRVPSLVSRSGLLGKALGERVHRLDGHPVRPDGGGERIEPTALAEQDLERELSGGPDGDSEGPPCDVEPIGRLQQDVDVEDRESIEASRQAEGNFHHGGRASPDRCRRGERTAAR